MPRYDYRCPECAVVMEVSHGMNESPSYKCGRCGSMLKRVFNSFNLGHGKRVIQRRVEDKLRAESDMKQDMRENHGVESFQPIAANSVADVYSDVKASGSFVKERMQAETEKAENARQKKSREWMQKAMKRAPERSQEKAKRRKAEEAKKRAVKA